MRVMITGGTGYVGSHIVEALLDAGHEVKLLVRRPEQVAKTFAERGVTIAPEDVVTGDVLDKDSVVSALEGCDAVVHAAAVMSLDPRRADEILHTNVNATTLVLNEALERGCDPVVHISSTVALIRYGGSGPDLPLGDIDLPYTKSKIASEEVVRGLQDQDRPVVSVYPGGIYGPDDPYYGEATQRVAFLVRGLFPMWSTGGLHTTDVRDAAAVVAAVMEPGKGPRRYIVPGHHMYAKDLYGALSQAIGRRRPYVTIPSRFAIATSKMMQLMQARVPEKWHYPADREGAEMGARDTRFDDSPARRDLGLTPRSLLDSLRDTITWLVDAGHLPAKYRPR
jgi:nucleoside-diphosphate-sugar epimerase